MTKQTKKPTNRILNAKTAAEKLLKQQRVRRDKYRDPERAAQTAAIPAKDREAQRKRIAAIMGGPVTGKKAALGRGLADLIPPTPPLLKAVVDVERMARDEDTTKLVVIQIVETPDGKRVNLSTYGDVVVDDMASVQLSILKSLLEKVAM